MPILFAHRVLDSAARIAALLLIAAALTAPPATAETRMHFDIPPEPLSEALLDFSAQAHAEFLSPKAPLAERSTLGIFGDMTPSEALSGLLRCSGLKGRLVNGAIVLEREQGAEACSAPTQWMSENASLKTPEARGRAVG